MAQPQRVLSALVSGDGRTIYVSARGGGCTTTAILTAVENPTSVLLRLNGYQPRKTGSCIADLVSWTRSTTLATPLGSRRLIDGLTHHAVPYIDGRHLAAVTWLPPGASAPANSLYPPWTRSYRFPGRRPAAPVTITQDPKNLLGTGEFSSDFYQLSHPEVDGHSAILERQIENGRVLVARLAWREHGYTFVVAGDPDYGYQRPQTPAVLLHIARSLRLPTSAE